MALLNGGFWTLRELPLRAKKQRKGTVKTLALAPDYSAIQN